MALRLAEVTLSAPRGALGALVRFYGEVLELPVAGVAVQVGPDRLVFEERDGEPFHHVALQVPGDRFAAAHAWLRERAELLPGPWEPGGTVFDFPAWDAQACYCHDPAGTILELIAHRGLAERPGAGGSFAGRELAGISEAGLVLAEREQLTARLAGELGVELWDGHPSASLAFVGRRAHTLILAPPGRGWLPTGRPAEPHPVRVRLRGAPRAPGRVALGPHVVEADVPPSAASP